MSNLTVHRSSEKVWDRVDPPTWDVERWLAGLAAGRLVMWGFRRRSPLGLFFIAGGTALAWWAAARRDDRVVKRGRLKAAVSRATAGDAIDDASAASFPASDASAWTASTGNSVR